MTRLTPCNELAQKLTIGICTKDRWSELFLTITELRRIGLGNLPIIIVDDASEEDNAAAVAKDLPHAVLFRSDLCAGLVAQRNMIARQTKTEYLAILDDDSCFTAPHSLKLAVEYLDKHPNVGVLALDVHEPEGPQLCPGNECVKPERPHSTAVYIGCGHILRVQLFQDLGGYREFFTYMCEERDYAMRIYARGFEIHHFPATRVAHRRSPIGRSSVRFHFFTARNTILCWLLNVPVPVATFFATRAVIGLGLRTLRDAAHFRATIRGVLAGLQLSFKHWDTRSPMSLCAFRLWFQHRQTR